MTFPVTAERRDGRTTYLLIESEAELDGGGERDPRGPNLYVATQPMISADGVWYIAAVMSQGSR